MNRRLAEFVGGDAEIQNPNEGYVFRGTIERAFVDAEEFHIVFSRIAEMVRPGEWVERDTKPYATSLRIGSFSEIGEERLAFNSPIIGELTVLFPVGGSRLEWSKVAAKGSEL